MEAKKRKSADLRNKSTLFLEIGMVVALGLVIAAFQWSTSEKLYDENLQFTLNVAYEPELIPITTPEEKKKQEQPKTVETLVLVEDILEIDEVEIQPTEFFETTEVAILPIGDEDLVAEDSVFIIVEEEPVFPGGFSALIRTISKHIEYPEIAKETGTKGRVFVNFVVNQQGKVEQVKVIRGVDPLLDREAARVISNLPDWTPGKQRGKPVKVAFTVPINFQLN
ncbi:MAG: energy transducer TonB [Bacteroidetes bacterium HGW-Bacteroidetes-4]|jgi:protein TonB|nr:MAG: energy transducer TonB [Bacteroidetes bacterium HGW-Bacteroidetes-4]